MKYLYIWYNYQRYHYLLSSKYLFIYYSSLNRLQYEYMMQNLYHDQYVPYKIVLSYLICDFRKYKIVYFKYRVFSTDFIIQDSFVQLTFIGIRVRVIGSLHCTLFFRLLRYFSFIYVLLFNNFFVRSLSLVVYYYRYFYVYYFLHYSIV